MLYNCHTAVIQRKHRSNFQSHTTITDQAATSAVRQSPGMNYCKHVQKSLREKHRKNSKYIPHKQAESKSSTSNQQNEGRRV